MEKIKKVWKELSVFGIVLVVFIALFVYRKVMFAEYTTLTQTELVEKVKDKDNFVVIVGNTTDNTTLSYQNVMQKFVDKNRDESLYFVDLKDNKDADKFIKETFKTDETSIPQTFVISKGEVKAQKSGALTYYRLTELYKQK